MENNGNSSQGKFETIEFEQKIKADPKKVYQTMLDEESYGKWTAAFAPGCHFKGSWEEGSEIQFLSPNRIGEMDGMFSKIKENKPAEKITIEHQGIIQDSKEISEGNETEKWSGAIESYSFKEEDGSTLLTVKMDIPPQDKGYFMEAWEQALVSLKEICEN